MKRLQDHNFFEKINTEEKAYFLGLIYADGNLYMSKRANSIEVSISLQEGDKHILEKLQSLIYIDNPKPLEFVKKRKEHHKNQYKFITHSRKIFDDLLKLGLSPRKSRILKFPTESQVPHYLLRHFIRGYFDGDGSIYLQKPSKKSTDFPCYRCSVCGTEHFSTELRKLLSKELSSIIEKHNNSFILRILGSRSSFQFLNWLYSESSVYLTRKFNRFQDLILLMKKIEENKKHIQISIGKFSQKEFCTLIGKSRGFVYKKNKVGISYQELFDKYGEY